MRAQADKPGNRKYNGRAARKARRRFQKEGDESQHRQRHHPDEYNLPRLPHSVEQVMAVVDALEERDCDERNTDDQARTNRHFLISRRSHELAIHDAGHEIAQHDQEKIAADEKKLEGALQGRATARDRRRDVFGTICCCRHLRPSSLHHCNRRHRCNHRELI